MNSFISMIIFAGCIQGLFLTGLVLFSKKNLRLKLPLAGLLAAFTINLGHSKSILDLFGQSPEGLRVFEPVQLLIGPLLYIFCRNLLTQRKGYCATDLLHALPFVTAVFLQLPVTGRGHELQSIANTHGIWFQRWFIGALELQVFIYLGVCHRIFTGWKQDMQNEYASDSYSDLAWLRTVMAGLTVSYAAYIPIIFWLLHGGPVILNEILSLLAAVFVYAIGYFALGKSMNSIRQPEKATQEQFRQERYRNSPLSKDASGKLYLRLCSLMDTGRLFTDEEISLQNLAKQMNIAPYQLSQVINENSGKNFFEFINTYRVEEVKRLIKNSDKKTDTLLELAFQAGFNSKPTFNKVFKQITGMTPSMFSSLHDKK